MSVLGLRHQPCGSDGPRLGAPNGYAPLTLNLFPQNSEDYFSPDQKDPQVIGLTEESKTSPHLWLRGLRTRSSDIIHPVGCSIPRVQRLISLSETGSFASIGQEVKWQQIQATTTKSLGL